MGLSRKISRIGKTKKEKEAIKLIKTSSQSIDKDKKASLHSKQVSKTSKKLSSTVDNAPKKTMGKKSFKSSNASKYVTEGMVDYVTLLRSRKSGLKLRREMPQLK
jgi:hypothetical protein